MSTNELSNLADIAIGLSSPGYRIVLDGEKANQVLAGTMLAGIKNQFTQTVVKVMGHPLMPDGKIIGYTRGIDYPDSGVDTNLALFTNVHWQQDFFARTSDVAPPGPWAIKTYGAPVLYWPKSCFVLANIGR